MLLYSTILPIKKSMSKKDFIDLVIEWNQNSPHEDNIIPNIVWNGENNASYQFNNLSLEIVCHEKEHIVAVRYNKIEYNGVLWSTHYVMNFLEYRLSIQLERSYTEDAYEIDHRFSTPYIISMLINRGLLEDDNGLYYDETPLFINTKNLKLLSDIIVSNKRYNVPIIYVSKNIYNKYPVDIVGLAKKLKGTAHIFAQENVKDNQVIREACAGKNEYYGCIGIYYPNIALPHKKIFADKYKTDNEFLLKKITDNVFNYIINQNIDYLYTWQGVNNALLNSEIEKRKSDFQKLKNDKDKDFEQQYSELEKLLEKVEALTKDNDALKAENIGLHTKLQNIDNQPILYYGNEEDFYPGEIKDILLSVLSNALPLLHDNSRRKCIVKDIIINNNYEKVNEEKANEIKRILKGYKNVTSIKSDLIGFGFEISEEGKHIKLKYYGDDRFFTTISKTASDGRTGNNAASKIINTML